MSDRDDAPDAVTVAYITHADGSTEEVIGETRGPTTTFDKPLVLGSGDAVTMTFSLEV